MLRAALLVMLVFAPVVIAGPAEEDARRQALMKAEADRAAAARAMADKAAAINKEAAASTVPNDTLATAGMMHDKDFDAALKGHDVIEVIFRGVKNTARATVQEVSVKPDAGVLAITPVAGPANTDEIHVVARLSPEIVEQLRNLRKELHDKRFLPINDAIVWSEPADEKSRKEVSELAIPVAGDFVKMLRAESPKVLVDPEKAAKAPVLAHVSLALSDGTRAVLRITQITPEKAWLIKEDGQPSQWAHFKKLGLIASLHYKPNPVDAEAIARAKSNNQPVPHTEALELLQSAFADALTPLLKRERTAEIQSDGW